MTNRYRLEVYEECETINDLEEGTLFTPTEPHTLTMGVVYRKAKKDPNSDKRLTPIESAQSPAPDGLVFVGGDCRVPVIRLDEGTIENGVRVFRRARKWHKLVESRERVQYASNFFQEDK